MSRFSKLSHVLWHGQYHIVWVPKYRHRIFKERVAFELCKSIRVYSERLGCDSRDQCSGRSRSFVSKSASVRAITSNRF